MAEETDLIQYFLSDSSPDCSPSQHEGDSSPAYSSSDSSPSQQWTDFTMDFDNLENPVLVCDPPPLDIASMNTLDVDNFNNDMFSFFLPTPSDPSLPQQNNIHISAPHALPSPFPPSSVPSPSSSYAPAPAAPALQQTALPPLAPKKVTRSRKRPLPSAQIPSPDSDEVTLSRDTLLTISSQSMDEYVETLQNQRHLSATEQRELKRQKRLIKNREAAKSSRDRKQAYIEQLEAHITTLNTEIAQLKQENESMRNCLTSSSSSPPLLAEDDAESRKQQISKKLGGMLSIGGNRGATTAKAGACLLALLFAVGLFVNNTNVITSSSLSSPKALPAPQILSPEMTAVPPLTAGFQNEMDSKLDRTRFASPEFGNPAKSVRESAQSIMNGHNTNMHAALHKRAPLEMEVEEQLDMGGRGTSNEQRKQQQQSQQPQFQEEALLSFQERKQEQQQETQKRQQEDVQTVFGAGIEQASTSTSSPSSKPPAPSPTPSFTSSSSSSPSRAPTQTSTPNPKQFPTRASTNTNVINVVRDQAPSTLTTDAYVSADFLPNPSRSPSLSGILASSPKIGNPRTSQTHSQPMSAGIFEVSWSPDFDPSSDPQSGFLLLTPLPERFQNLSDDSLRKVLSGGKLEDVHEHENKSGYHMTSSDDASGDDADLTVLDPKQTHRTLPPMVLNLVIPPELSGNSNPLLLPEGVSAGNSLIELTCEVTNLSITTREPLYRN